MKKYKVGITFGAFDLCHMGHINLLRQAKERCEWLVVCASSDEYIIHVKGHEPLLTLDDRIYLIGLTGYADIVRKGDLWKKEQLLYKYKPNVAFIGDDWKNTNYALEGLCEMEYLKRFEGISATWYRDNIIWEE